MLNTLEALEGRQLMAAGTLDTSFGTAGTASVRVQQVGANAAATTPVLMRVDASGRTVTLTESSGVINLTRLTADGTPDARFAAATNNEIDIANAGDKPVKLWIDGSNRIYVLLDSVLTRYKSSGKIDRSFGNRGHVVPSANSDAYLVGDFALAQGGSVYFNGEAAFDDGEGSMAVVRYTSAGQLDTSFGTNGVYTAPAVPIRASFNVGTPTINVTGDFIRVLADGSIVAAGKVEIDERSESGFVPRQTGVETVKFTSKGQVDTTYNRHGISAYTINATDLVPATSYPVGIRSDGSIVTYNHLSSTSAMNFTLDATGHYGGFVDFGTVLSHAQFIRQSDGREIIVDTDNQTLVRVNDDDTPDNAFNGGEAITGVSAATVGADGSIIYGLTGRNAMDAKFYVRRVFGSEGPAGRLVPTTLVAPGSELPFRVVFRDDDGVSASSITSQVLRIISPDGTATRPILTGVSEANGNVVADFTYRPADRKLNADDNGVYLVRLLGGRALDIHGNAADARTLGSLAITIEA
ncbi:MAG: hypothetical protein JWM57_1354 [Phycisphaerales bacterium]|nr:hypothetical protein [Phycisphaerales bacterium]